MLLLMTSSFIIAPPVTFVKKSFRGAVGKCWDRHDQVGLKVTVEAVVVFGTVAVVAADEMESVSTAKTADAAETPWCAVGIIWHSVVTTWCVAGTVSCEVETIWHSVEIATDDEDGAV